MSNIEINANFYLHKLTGNEKYYVEYNKENLGKLTFDDLNNTEIIKFLLRDFKYGNVEFNKLFEIVEKHNYMMPKRYKFEFSYLSPAIFMYNEIMSNFDHDNEDIEEHLYILEKLLDNREKHIKNYIDTKLHHTKISGKDLNTFFKNTRFRKRGLEINPDLNYTYTYENGEVYYEVIPFTKIELINMWITSKINKTNISQFVLDKHKEMFRKIQQSYSNLQS